MAYAIMRIKKIKSNPEFTKIMEHNYRLTPVLNADPSLQHTNEELIKLQFKSYKEAFENAINKSDYYKTHKIRKNAVRGLEILMTHTDDISTGLNLEAWKRKNIDWIKETFGEKNIASMIYHGDESTPHIHAVVFPIINDRLNAYHILGNRQKMRELQDSYAKTMQPLGLERGLKGSVAKKTDIKKFYSLLNKELEKKLPEIKKGETIEKYKARAEAVYEATNLNYLNERLKAERKLVEVKTKHNNEIIKHKKDISSLKNKLKTYEGFEREFGNIDALKKELNEYRTLKNGLHNLKQIHPEETSRIDIFNEYMESVMKWEKKRNKLKEKEIEKFELARDLNTDK